MELSPIWEAFRGPVNDVLVCRDLRSPVDMRYTLLVIHDRACVKQMLTVLEQSERERGRAPYLLRFSQNELMCFVFEYRPGRRLSAFGPGQMADPRVRETVCVNLVMECLSTPLPYPLLYLVLLQDNVQVQKDNSVYFTPCLDLSQLNPGKGEASCVPCCAELLLGLLEGGGRRRKKLKSYELIRKKTAKNAYSAFPELYRDIKVTALPERKESLKGRLKGCWLRHRDRIFRLLLVLSAVAVVVALIMLISQIIFGDIPLLRLFERAFEQIGTESLIQ